MATLYVRGFYDALAPWYHLVYLDWEASAARQGQALASLLASEWGSRSHNVLAVAVGILTQAIGLATLGFQITGSDISPARSTAPVTRPHSAEFDCPVSLRT